MQVEIIVICRYVTKNSSHMRARGGKDEQQLSLVHRNKQRSYRL
ncbi:hypothetical protein ACP70R_023950 [Stipagrostis hirtigluma subsp. patula]